MFRGLLDKTVQYVHASGEDIDIFEILTYLSSIVHFNCVPYQEVIRRIGLFHSAMDSLKTSIRRCRYLCRRTKIPIFNCMCSPSYSLTVRHRHWIATWQNRLMPLVINAFAESRYIAGITLSNRRLLREADSRPIIFIVRERQIRLYWHETRYPEADTAHRFVSIWASPVWRTPMGHPQSS